MCGALSSNKHFTRSDGKTYALLHDGWQWMKQLDLVQGESKKILMYIQQTVIAAL